MLECLGLFSSSLGLGLKIGFGSETDVFGFVVCFGVWGSFWPKMEVVKWTKPGLVQGDVETV